MEARCLSQWSWNEEHKAGKLCDLNPGPKKRELLQRSHMSTIKNLQRAALRSEAPAPALTVSAFWETTYLNAIVLNQSDNPTIPTNGGGIQSSTPKTGMTYWRAFSNPTQAVRRGHRVDVVIGSFRANNLIVE